MSGFRGVARWWAGSVCAVVVFAGCSSGSSPAAGKADLCEGWLGSGEVAALLPAGLFTGLEDLGADAAAPPGLPGGCEVWAKSGSSAPAGWRVTLAFRPLPRSGPDAEVWTVSARGSVPSVPTMLGPRLEGVADASEARVLVPPCGTFTMARAASLRVEGPDASSPDEAVPGNRARIAAALVSAVNAKRRQEGCQGRDLPAPNPVGVPVRGEAQGPEQMCGLPGTTWQDVLPGLRKPGGPVAYGSVATPAGYSFCGVGVHVEPPVGQGAASAAWVLSVRTTTGEQLPGDTDSAPPEGARLIDGFRGTAWASPDGVARELRSTCRGNPFRVHVDQYPEPGADWLSPPDETFRRITVAAAAANGCEPVVGTS